MTLVLGWDPRQCVRVVEMDSKSIGLCPQGFESPRCRLDESHSEEAIACAKEMRRDFPFCGWPKKTGVWSPWVPLHGGQALRAGREREREERERERERGEREREKEERVRERDERGERREERGERREIEREMELSFLWARGELVGQISAK